MSQSFVKIVANETEETKQWWDAARAAYRQYPESVPDAVHPLVDETWGETEVAATRNEARDVQAWAIGLPGWNATKEKTPLTFER